MKHKIPVILLLITIVMSAASCDVIASIFKAGMGVGIFLVLIVIALIVFLLVKLKRKK